MRFSSILAAICLCLFLMISVGETKAADSNIEGERIVRHVFTLFYEGNWSDIDELLAPDFQSIHDDGIRNRDEEMRYLMDRKLSSYTLSDFKTTVNGQVMVVTYKATIQGSTGEKRSSTSPSWRMSIFVQNQKRWLMLAHASTLPVEK
jgi:hypothetical protein